MAMASPVESALSPYGTLPTIPHGESPAWAELSSILPSKMRLIPAIQSVVTPWSIPARPTSRYPMPDVIDSVRSPNSIPSKLRRPTKVLSKD